MTKLLRLVLVASTAALAFAAANAAAGPVRLIEAGNAAFPDRAFSLTTSRPIHLDSTNVRVTENGGPVADLTVIPAGKASAGAFGVVLAVDASWSMRGKPIAGALAAARAFVASRGVNEQIGVVSFNRRVASNLVPTADAAAIARALARTPRLAVGTRIFDAVDAAIAQLTKAKVKLGSVVLLSDGRDTGSALTLSRLVKRANAAHVRVFTVGLRSTQFRASTLRKLAGETDAAYAEAGSPAALKPIYESLASRLSREYLIEYKSLAAPDTVIHVKVTAPGVSGASSAYQTPALPLHFLPPFHRSRLERFWLSGGSIAVVGLVAGLLIALAMMALIRGGKFPLRSRMGRFVALVDAQSREQAASKLAAAVERRFSRRNWWQKLAEEIEIAQFPISLAQLFLITLGVTVLLCFIVIAALPKVLIVFALFGPALLARAAVKRKLDQRRAKFGEQLPDNLNVLAAALRVGHSFVGALSVMIDESDDPARTEFRRAMTDEQLGMPVEEALVTVAERMANSDLEQVALVASLQRQTGGNTAQVLDTVVETIRERAEIRRLVKTLTTQGRAARWVLTGLPVLMFLLLTAINSEYMHPLYHTTTGQVLLVLAAIMVIAGGTLIKRIVDIKV
jgi:tight adherence protein B